MMRKQIIAALLSTLPIAAIASPFGATQSPWDVQPMTAPPQSMSPSDGGEASSTGATIAAGRAPIEQALSMIIPSSYGISLDKRVPLDWVVTWPEGSNWMTVLHQALAPMGLHVIPQWANNTVEILLDTPRTPIQPFVSRTQHIERLSVGAAQTIESPLMGATQSGWDDPAPASSAQRLDTAILRLLPSSLDQADLQINGVNTNTLVSWPGRQTRRQAFISVLNAVRARAEISPSQIRINPVPTPSSRVETPLPTTAVLTLRAGKPLGEQLREQGHAQGWTVVWNVDRDWIVPSTTALSGDFEHASSEAIESAAAEGAPLAATVYRANHTLVVTQTGVTNK